MELIRECQPKTFEEWKNYYFQKAYTKTKVPIKVTEEILQELGQRLYEKITEVVIPEWTEAFKQITIQDCFDYKLKTMYLLLKYLFPILQFC